MQRFRLSKFRRCHSGATAVLSAFTAAVLMLVSGGTIDYLYLVSMKTKMQQIADGASIRGARAITVAQTDEATVQAITKGYITASSDKTLEGIQAEVVVDLNARQVKVKLDLVAKTYFHAPFSNARLKASATAEVFGQMPICVLGLDDAYLGTITLRQNARLTGNGCAVYSNSTKANSITVDTGGQLVAGLVCSAGGGYGDIQPRLIMDCPVLDDPLAGRAVPSSAVCDETDKAIGIERSFQTSQLGQALSTGSEVLPELTGANLGFLTTTQSVEPTSSQTEPTYDGDTVILLPGVYCGGLLIGGNKSVSLEPGVYVMKDGPLYVSENARLFGRGVGFYFKGDNATLYFDARTSISLSAPTGGPLAGLLFYEDPSARPERLFSILSDDARELTGTIYLPGGTLVVDADRPVADQSAYTAIVARRLSLYAGPHLVLNTNYSETDVPVALDTQFSKGIRLVN